MPPCSSEQIHRADFSNEKSEFNSVDRPNFLGYYILSIVREAYLIIFEISDTVSSLDKVYKETVLPVSIVVIKRGGKFV